MKTDFELSRSLAVMAFAAAMTVGSAFAYEDEFLEITGDESVRTNWTGGRVVYIFTNKASAVTATFKQNMTLEEVLVVGGGGAGGGGGGGGVIYHNDKAYCPAYGSFTVVVGAGGLASTIGDSRAQAKPQGKKGAGYGSPSSFVFGGMNLVAFGGGGGGSDSGSTTGAPSKMTETVSIGCGGGSGAKMTGSQTAEYYTASQGNYGGVAYSSGGTGGTGGGGGALTAGQTAGSGRSGDGGEGVTNSISGVAEVYGSGGGGGGAVAISSGPCDPGVGGTHAGDGLKGKTPSQAGCGDDGFGAGGGGGGYDGGASAGGNGGVGTVIVAFSVGGQASKPEFGTEDILVAYPNGETQPYVSVRMGGEAGYSAEVKILTGIGETYTSTNVFEAVKSGDEPGDYALIYPAPDETFNVKVIATADGVPDTVVTKSVTVPFDQGLKLPAHVGKGGGEHVIHVRVGAHGRNDGTSWTDAFTDFRAAIALLSSERNEVWLAGDETVGISAVTISPSSAAAIRGGFTGVENAPSERRQGGLSTLDGQGLYDCITINNTNPITIDGFLMKRGIYHGMTKNGVGAIVVTNCVFDGNGTTGELVSGRALYIAGSTASTTATVANCTMLRHYERATAGAAGTLSLNSLKQVGSLTALSRATGLPGSPSPRLRVPTAVRAIGARRWRPRMLRSRWSAASSAPISGTRCTSTVSMVAAS